RARWRYQGLANFSTPSCNNGPSAWSVAWLYEMNAAYVRSPGIPKPSAGRVNPPTSPGKLSPLGRRVVTPVWCCTISVDGRGERHRMNDEHLPGFYHDAEAASRNG